MEEALPEPSPLVVDRIELRDEPVLLSPPEPPYVTGGPPFPPFPTDDHKHGLSILDYFAAHIMGGLCARQDMTVDDLKTHGPQDAYWMAALMVDVRGKLPIEPTPAPPVDGEEEQEIAVDEGNGRIVRVKVGRKRPLEL